MVNSKILDYDSYFGFHGNNGYQAFYITNRVDLLVDDGFHASSWCFLFTINP